MSITQSEINMRVHEFLWRGYPAHYLFEVRSTLKRPGKCLPLDEALDRLPKSKAFGILPRLTQGSSRENLALAGNVLWVDVDRIGGVKGVSDRQIEDLVESRLDPLELIPSVAVDSGGGYWLYWKLSHMVPINQIERLNRGLTKLLGGDTCFDPPRVARSFGSVKTL